MQYSSQQKYGWEWNIYEVVCEKGKDFFYKLHANAHTK